MIITESDMTFDLPDDACFHIEESKVYKSIRSGVKIAEFLFRKKDSVIWCVEVKSSTPHPDNPLKVSEFISDIKDKLLNTFSLFFALLLGRHSTTNELPPALQTCDLSTVKVQFVLVINTERTQEGLFRIRDDLYNALYPTCKTWNLGPTPVIVLNDENARKRGLIQ